MARPKMKFTPDEAVSLIRAFAAGLEDHDFCSKHLVKEAGSRYAVGPYEPKKALEPLVAMADAARSYKADPVPFPEEGCTQLKDWIADWVSPEGWTRLLAARRQRALKERKKRSSDTRESAVDMPDMAAYYLLKMAERVGLDRKAYIGRLVQYLQQDENGKKALQLFERGLQDAMRKETRSVLLAVFGCTPGHLDYVLEQLPGDYTAKHDQAYQAAHELGKAKLQKLAAWAKRVDAENPLRAALFPRADTAGVSPLMALSSGVPLPSQKNNKQGDHGSAVASSL